MEWVYQKLRVKISKTSIEKKFVGVNWVFVFIFSNEDNNAKTYKAQRYYLPKGLIKRYNVIINEKNLYVQPIDSDRKQYKEIEMGVSLTSWEEGASLALVGHRSTILAKIYETNFSVSVK